MHHLLKTIHARDGLKNWSNTNEPDDWKSSWQSEWCRRDLGVMLKWKKTLITASINTQLLEEQKVIGLLPGYVSEMSAFVISTGNIYLHISFVVPLCPATLIAWIERIPDRYQRMLTKHLPVFWLASSKSCKITWDLVLSDKIVINSRSCGWILGPSALPCFWFGMLFLQSNGQKKFCYFKQMSVLHYFYALQISALRNLCALGTQAEFFKTNI